MINILGSQFDQTPPAPAAVSGITWVHAWDLRYRNSDGSVPNSIDATCPLRYSSQTNAYNFTPKSSPRGQAGQVQSYLTAANLTGNVSTNNCVIVHVSHFDNSSQCITVNNGGLYLGSYYYTTFGSVKDYGVMTEAVYYAACNQWAVHVVRINSAATSTFGYCNQYGPAGSFSLPPLATISSLCIGSPITTFRGGCEFVAIGTMTGAISGAQVGEISRDRYLKHFASPKPKRILFVGNSLISGVGLEDYQTTPSQLEDLLDSTWGVTTLANPSMADVNLASYAAYQVDPMFRSASLADVLYYRETTNQAAGTSDDGATLRNNVKTYCETRQTNGWAGPIGISGCNKWRSDVNIEVKAAAYNALMLADFSVATSNPIVWLAGPGITYADFFVDIAGLALLATANSGGMQADGIHETAAVKVLEAAAINDALDAIGVL